MISKLAFYLIFGKPLIMYGGILTFLSFATTATIGYLIHHGKTNLSINWHINFVRLSFTIALFHAVLGLSLFFKF